MIRELEQRNAATIAERDERRQRRLAGDYDDVSQISERSGNNLVYKTNSNAAVPPSPSPSPSFGMSREQMRQAMGIIISSLRAEMKRHVADEIAKLRAEIVGAMNSQDEFNEAARIVWEMPLQLRLTLLVMSIVEANRTTPKIAKAMLGMLTAISALHGTNVRFELAEIFRDHADAIERPKLN